MPTRPDHKANGEELPIVLEEHQTHPLDKEGVSSQHSKIVVLLSNQVLQQVSRTHRQEEQEGSRDQQESTINNRLNRATADKEAIVIILGHKLQGKVFQLVVGRGMLKNVTWSSNCRVSGKLCSAVKAGVGKMSTRRQRGTFQDRPNLAKMLMLLI